MYPNFDCQWIPVALTADIPAATVIPVWTPAGRFALWRSQSGKLTAAAERCPHRGMRLSHGFVRGEILSCIYHGWSFDKTGVCRKIPAHPDLEPPQTIRTTLQTVMERDGIVWLTDGETDQLPPVFAGFSPLRTITLNAPPVAIAAAAGGTEEPGGALSVALAGIATRLLLKPEDDGRTQAHILVPDETALSQKIAVSRAFEGLRRAAETRMEDAA